MTIKCLLACTNEVMQYAVESALKTEGDLEVVRVKFECEKDLIREVQQHNPQILILDQGGFTRGHSKLLRPLLNQPQIILILVNSHDNKMQVYQKREVDTLRAEDILAIIRNG